MDTIINISTVTDYSGETPVVTDSNPVRTVVNAPVPEPIITRYFYCCPCRCNCCCNCCYGCDD